MTTDSETPDRDQTVADYWDAHTDETFTRETYWLAHPDVCRRFHCKSVGGQQDLNWVNYCVQRYLHDGVADGLGEPAERVLNIGCGDGALDRHLASLNAASTIDAIDIAPGRIDIARAEAEKAGAGKIINYVVANAETSDFPHSDYDAIFFDSSLHHIDRLEDVLQRCASSLKPGGVLIANEYIGPNRYRFSEREMEAMSALFKLIPARYRVSHVEHDRGQTRAHMGFPDPVEVERVDPSEAIRSEDIEPVLRQFFDIEEFNSQGGTLLQFALQDIVGNFNNDEPKDQALLDMLFQIEDTLVECGDLTPHFALIVARAKQ